jgi:hypothetical protein
MSFGSLTQKSARCNDATASWVAPPGRTKWHSGRQGWLCQRQPTEGDCGPGHHQPSRRARGRRRVQQMTAARPGELGSVQPASVHQASSGTMARASASVAPAREVVEAALDQQPRARQQGDREKGRRRRDLPERPLRDQVGRRPPDRAERRVAAHPWPRRDEGSAGESAYTTNRDLTSGPGSFGSRSGRGRWFETSRAHSPQAREILWSRPRWSPASGLSPSFNAKPRPHNSLSRVLGGTGASKVG